MSNSKKEGAPIRGNWIDTYLAYTDNTEPPRIFREWCAISVIAAALQRKCWLEWGTVMMYPNLYIVLTAPAGRARKGTAMKPARDLLEYLSIPISAEAVTRESLIRLLCQSERTIPGDWGGTHSSLTVFSPELTVFLGYSNLQLIADLTDWFDCAQSWTYHTKNSGTDPINGVFLNLLGATTPDLIKSALPQDAVGGGLTSRMIFVYADKKGKTVPFPFLSAEAKALWPALQSGLDAIHSLSGPFSVTKDFLERWGDWYIQNDGKSPFGLVPCRTLDGYVERRPTHLLKLTMIISASKRQTMEITGDDFDEALLLLHKTELNMPRAVGGVGESQFASLTSRIYEFLLRCPANMQTLLQNFLYDGSSEVIGLIVNTLIKADLVEATINSQGLTIYKAILDENKE